MRSSSDSAFPDTPIVTVKEAASLLKVSAWSIYELVRTKQVPAYRVGRAIRIPLRLLLEQLSESQEQDLIAEARRLYQRQVRATECALRALQSNRADRAHSR